MKKLILFCMLFLFACGQDTAIFAGQAGVGGSNNIPVHGHNGPNDGGTIELPSFNAGAITTDKAISCGTGTNLKSVLSTVISDNKNWYNPDTVTYTPQIAGTYLFTTKLCMHGATSTTQITAVLGTSGGVTIGQMQIIGTLGTSTQCITATGLAKLNGTTDNVTPSYVVNGTGACTFDATQGVFFSGVLISK